MLTVCVLCHCVAATAAHAFAGVLASVCMSVGLNSSPHFVPFGTSSDLRSCFAASKHNTSAAAFAACLLRYLGNSALQGVTLYSVLGLMGNSMALMLCMQGYKPIDTMRNPLLHSLSPRDFWGKRWNLIVHGVLKVSNTHCSMWPHVRSIALISGHRPLNDHCSHELALPAYMVVCNTASALYMLLPLESIFVRSSTSLQYCLVATAFRCMPSDCPAVTCMILCCCSGAHTHQ
jgi:hypothetical protein